MGFQIEAWGFWSQHLNLAHMNTIRYKLLLSSQSNIVKDSQKGHLDPNPLYWHKMVMWAWDASYSKTDSIEKHTSQSVNTWGRRCFQNQAFIKEYRCIIVTRIGAYARGSSIYMRSILYIANSFWHSGCLQLAPGGVAQLVWDLRTCIRSLVLVVTGTMWEWVLSIHYTYPLALLGC